MTVSKFKFSSRFLSVLLCIALLLSYAPFSSLTAYALDIPTEKNITFGASHITGAQQSNVYFGNYQQSSLGNTEPTNGTEGIDWIKSSLGQINDCGAYYSIDPIKWSVLSNADGKLFLLSAQNLDVFQYHTVYYKTVTWETSTIRSWLNGYGSTSNTQKEDYTSDNFIGTAFSAAEQTVIANTTDKVFLLSSEEAQNTNYGFTSNSKRSATNTAYVAGGGKIGGGMWGAGAADSWWLRSPVSKVDSSYNATYVAERGSILNNGINVDSYSVAVRPAFNMDISSILFTSAAKGGKSATTELVKNVDISTLTDSDGYKLTLSDSSRSAFKATISSISDNTVNVSYSGATTGANEYISAIIKDESGKVTYYGKLKNVADTADAEGTVTLDLSGKINRTDKLYIFNEQYNGDYKTDYASELIEIGYTITFDAGDGTVSPTTAVTGPNGKLASLPTPTRENYNFIGWYTAAEGGDKVDTDKVYTGNTTIYAVWEEKIINATAVTINNSNITLTVGDTETLIATVVPENATVKSVIWNSLKPEIATVDQNGEVTAVAPGTAVITATHATDTECNTFCVVTVNAIDITGSVIISGNAVCDRTLTANYSGNETVTYQWYRGTEAISGATSSTYTLTDADIGNVINVKVSGTGNYKGESMAETATAVVKRIVPTFDKVPTAKSELVYNGSEQELISAGLTANGTVQYALGTAQAAAGEWKTELPKATKAYTYYVWYKVIGNDNYSDLAPVCVTVKIEKAEQAAPVVGKTNETAGGKKDGAITDVNSTMEYRKDGDDTYTAISGDTVAGLAAGKYYVRVKGDSNHNPSPDTEVIITADKKQFKDIDTTKWYYAATNYVISNGIMSGYPDNSFRPSETLTRAMIVQILYNLEGKPAVNGTDSFTDTDDSAWYAKAIAWAQQNGVAAGYGGGKFVPDDNVTREQTAVILYNYCKLKGYDLTEGSIESFTDADAVSNYAKEEIRWAVGNGVIKGMEDGTLRPRSTATRAEIAQMIKNFADNIKQTLK